MKAALLRLLAGCGAVAVTYWMIGQPGFMRFWLLLAALLILSGVALLRMHRSSLGRFLIGLGSPVLCATAIFWATGQPQFWESQIAAYEKADRVSPPPPGVIVFAGGSSIRKWETLREDMQPFNVINRGCGGCELSHVSYYEARIIKPYRPRAVVLYAGDNDLTLPPWKSPATVLSEFQNFVALLHRDLPETWVFYISMKPAPWGNWPRMDQTNHLIAAYARTQVRVQFIDVSAAMLDSTGKLRSELYGLDPMHMNASGYALWKSIVKPVLLERLGPVP